jgi:cholesterol oxidase
MKKITRRNLLKNTAIAGAAVGAYSPFGKATAATTTTTVKAAIIGSGFGGSVTALRLAKAGIQTALIERGRDWRGATFPTLAGGGDGLLWTDPPSRIIPGSTGLLQEYIDSTMIVGCGAGLGGGSLVYGGVLLQPRQEIFQKALPFLNYNDFATKYYPRVLSKVSGGPIPDDILNSPNYTSMRVFIDTATKAGLTVVRSECGFNWNVIRKEVNGTLPALAPNGEWVFGENNGAKNTLDKNYIAEAAATGKVSIFTLRNVYTIRRATATSNFQVYCDVLNQAGAVIGQHIIECKYLFMAAGSINTTKLLLKAKALGDLKTVNTGVGQSWGTNGDHLMGMKDVTAALGTQGGPPAIAAFDLKNSIQPVGFMHSPSPSNGATTQLQMGMCIPNKLSTVTYSLLTDRISFNWSETANTACHNALLNTIAKMEAVGGGTTVDQTAMGTWHPVGGAAMGVACSVNGALNGTSNLFVMDGASIPGSTGAANPSLTIGANAERMIEKIIPTLS